MVLNSVLSAEFITTALDGAHRAIEAQHVPGGGEVRHCVGIRRTVLAEDVAVLVAAAGEKVVASAAFDPVVAGVAVDGVVAGAADDRVVAAAAGEEVVAAEAID